MHGGDDGTCSNTGEAAAVADVEAVSEAEVLYTSAAAMVAAVADGIASKLRVSSALAAPQQGSTETTITATARITLDAGNERGGSANEPASICEPDVGSAMVSGGTSGIQQEMALLAAAQEVQAEAEAAARPTPQDQKAPLLLADASTRANAVGPSSDAAITLPALHEVLVEHPLATPAKRVPVCSGGGQLEDLAASAAASPVQPAEGLPIAAASSTPAVIGHVDSTQPAAADSASGLPRHRIDLSSADGPVADGEGLTAEPATGVGIATGVSCVTNAPQLSDVGKPLMCERVNEGIQAVVAPPLHEVPVENPEPTPAKRVPVSPPGAQQPVAEALGSTPASLPPVPRAGGTTETVLGSPASSSVAMYDQLDQRFEEVKVLRQTTAEAVEPTCAAAQAGAGQLVIDGLEPASEPVEQPQDTVHVSDRVDASAQLGDSLLEQEDDPTVGAVASGTAAPADGAPVQGEGGRRASVIMMDAAHTPEVCNS